ncbi:trigger factor-like protein TIG, Chloroplastic isoform X2 [Vigna radiata var. radiata]|uniref:Trigger factor-like protein TIG, Chloroplastic isoform X2 n=1 Tax=Vigna radiata var. radiata TaxID=3916 RepID=A0A3Q0FF98_VIGRR|nr:trigger factor-like protein TIG, Chloroplastic isoform X2 [Vigna radiata var. radiata]
MCGSSISHSLVFDLRNIVLELWFFLSENYVQVCDIAVLDISATTIDQDESNVKNIPSSKGFNFDIEDGDKVLPGFLDSIIGIHRGESKSFPLVFPETWKQENLRGVHAQFNRFARTG